MKFDTLIIGGGLSGLVCGISLQEAGQQTCIVSTGQNALHFFSGSFESLQKPSPRLTALFEAAGIRLHYREGVRLMPMGRFAQAALSLEDCSLFADPHFARKALILSIPGYHDFFPAFLSDGLGQQGIACQVRELVLPELQQLGRSPSEMRSVQIARILDRDWQKVVEQVRLLLRDEDAVILPQVFGLDDPAVPGRIREALPAQVVFVGTLPPSVPGMRTQLLLKKRYQLLGGTYLSGDTALRSHVHDGVVHSIATQHLDNHYLAAGHFILASGHFFSKGLCSNPFRIWEPVFGLDVDAPEDRNRWYDPAFAADQPYLGYGVRTDEALHPSIEGVTVRNLYAVGSVLGATRPEFGTAAGQAIRSAFAAVDHIL